MHTFNVPLKNGKQLTIPAEYYPRYAEIVATKENSFVLTRISRFEALIKSIHCCILNPVFSVLLIINLNILVPLFAVNQKFSSSLIGVIISYYLTKLYVALTKNSPISRDSVAEELGYKSSSSLLKPYDERMLKAIIIANGIKIRRHDLWTSLFFDDLYGIIFDVPTSRGVHDLYYRPMKLIK